MINRDMKSMILQEKVKVPTKSGATKYDWGNDKNIKVAIYKTNDISNTQNIIYNSSQSIKYNLSTHKGLTLCKDIEEGINRLIDNGTVYEVTGTNPKGRLATLFLKVVDTNV